MATDWTQTINESQAHLRALAENSGVPALAFALPADRIAGDEAEIAQVVTDGEIAQRLSDVHQSLRAQIGRALDRLALGRYGYCEDCDTQIPAERMEFAPETTRCVNCQARRDRMG